MEQDKNARLALRSEKARKLIGAIPTSLVRYGLVLIPSVLTLLVAIASYFPYREVYHGDLRIAPKSNDFHSDCRLEDTIDVQLRFEGKRITTLEKEVELSIDEWEQSISLVRISFERDADGFQEAIIRLKHKDENIYNRRFTFRLSLDKGSILSQFVR
jgi:hypothetical protein